MNVGPFVANVSDKTLNLCYSGPPEQNLLAPDQGIKARDHLSLWEFTQRYAYQASGRDRANSQEGHPASPQKQACDL